MKKTGKKCVSIVACTAMAMAVLTGTGIGASADDVTLEVETSFCFPVFFSLRHRGLSFRPWPPKVSQRP